MTPQPKDPRIYLAAERTLLAWIRTGLALMGFGFVVDRFGLSLQEIGSAAPHIPVRSLGFSLWTGLALVLAGVIVNVASTWQYIRMIHDLNAGRDITRRPSSLGLGMAAILSLIGVAIAVYLFVER